MQQLKPDIYLETLENNIFFRNNHYTINDDNINDNKRTIMVVNDEFAENEIKTTNILKIIKNYEFYFNIYQDMQNVKIGQLNQVNFERMDLYQDNHILFTYNDKHKIDFTTFMMTFKTCKDFLLNFLESYREILNILCIIKSNNLCIFNISPSTILFDNSFKPQLSNFTKTFSLNPKKYSQINFERYFHGENFVYKPIELHLLYYILNNDDLQLDIETIDIISSKFVENVKIFRFFSITFKLDYKERCVSFMKQYINMNKEDIIEDILKYSNTWDNYSVSIIYLHILSNIISSFSLREGFMVGYLDILVKNIAPNPLNRISVYEMAEEYDILFMQYCNWDFVSELNISHLQKLYERMQV